PISSVSSSDVITGGSALLQEYERMLALIEDVPCAVWEIETGPDGRARRFSYLSHSVESLFGHPYEYLLDPQSWGLIVHPDDKEYFQEQIQKVFSESDHGIYRHRIVSADGRVIPIEAILHLVRSTDGVPVAIRG